MIKPARFLDPKSDLVFKKIFGQNPDLIKSFLNGILPLKNEELIEELEYLTPEQSPRIPSMKNTIVDVKCKDKMGRIFIVEMQLHWTIHFTKRLLFGASKAYVQQLEKTQAYHSLCPVYGLGIINEIFDRASEEWFHHYRTVNVKDTSKILEGLELIFLELPKFKPQTLEHKKMGILWLRFLKEINEGVNSIPGEFMDNPELSKAIELTQESAYTLEELEAYDKYWDAIRVENTIRHDAEQKGLEKGKQIGEQIGIEKEKIAIARAMIQKGMDAHKVAEFTGLSLERISSLKDLKD